jgi:hypothetical protein
MADCQIRMRFLMLFAGMIVLTGCAGTGDSYLRTTGPAPVRIHEPSTPPPEIVEPSPLPQESMASADVTVAEESQSFEQAGDVIMKEPEDSLACEAPEVSPLPEIEERAEEIAANDGEELKVPVQTTNVLPEAFRRFFALAHQSPASGDALNRPLRFIPPSPVEAGASAGNYPGVEPE